MLLVIFFKEDGQSSWVGTPPSGGPQAHVDRSALLDLDRNKNRQPLWRRNRRAEADLGSNMGLELSKVEAAIAYREDQAIVSSTLINSKVKNYNKNYGG